MHVYSWFVATLMLAVASARRGGGGGGSGGGGGGTSMIDYTEQECYASYLNPSWSMGNATDGHTSGPKAGADHWYWIWNSTLLNDSVNYITTRQPNISWQMEVFDAYYNGTFNVTLTPPSSGNLYTKCPKLTSPSIPNAFLRLGPQTHSNISRKAYGDENSYYLHFGRTISEEKCPHTANKAFINFESSNDELAHSQAWNLQQKKINNKFELSGEFTSTVAQYNNYWNYVVNTTGQDSDYPLECPRQFSMETLSAITGAKLTASVTAGEATMEFSFTDIKLGHVVTGYFKGSHWEEGPKILFSKDKIQTEGEVPHIKPRAPKKSSFTDGFGKWIIIGCTVAVVLAVAYILWHWSKCCFACVKCLFCCGSRKDYQSKKVSKKVTRDGDIEHQNGIPMVYKQPSSYVTPAFDSQNSTADATTVSYQVAPAVAESYGILGGLGYREITHAQEELHKAHVDMQSARIRGDRDGIMFAQTMVAHWTSVIEHYMAVRRGER